MTTSIQKKVLIIEDDHALRQVLSDRLQEEGFGVLTARDGVEGLHAAFLHRPSIILLDIFMPNMDGISMLHKLRNEDQWGATVFVMIITNSVDATTVATISGFLIKSEWGLEDIIARVKTHLS
jgi:DNA-binding response OmpR family regulator